MPRAKAAPIPPRDQRWPNTLTDEQFSALVARVQPDIGVLNDIIALALPPTRQINTEEPVYEDTRESA